MEKNDYSSREEVLSPEFLDLLDQQEKLSSDFAFKVIRPTSNNLHLLRVKITTTPAGWQRLHRLKETYLQTG
ncbi:hypothetical protein [Tellurirhabdus bombi]|uniref:hypothetical protein n=1 Tax=Tellurirhabdus bombi TaxID=2907205 RepID=UPI001F1E5DA8|nr:hypothetical protein [Tellurirhabdus bombi]